MATPAVQLNQLATSTLDAMRRDITDNIFQKVKLLAWLESKARVKVEGGNQVRRNVLYGTNSTVKSFSNYDTFDTTPQSGLAYAVYDWSELAGTVTISGTDLLKNAGEPRILDLLGVKFQQLTDSLRAELNTELWADGTGNAGKNFLGLQAIVLDSGTLGGIDSSVQTFWKSGVTATANISTAAGLTGIAAVIDARDNVNSDIDTIVGTSAIYEQYESLVLTAYRLQDPALGDLGIRNLQYKGIPWWFDKDAPAGALYFLNSQHLEFVQHSSKWMENSGFRTPIDQDAQTAFIVSAGQLVTDARRAHAKISTVTV